MPAPYKLHGVWLSGPTYKVGLMLAMTGQPFDYEHIALRDGAGQKPEYKAKSRWGQVPCLTVTGSGRHLTQSAAILGYLAEATGKFAGASTDERQDIREWLLWNADRLGPPLYRSRAIKLGLRKADPGTIEMYATEGKAALAVLDAHLQGRSWLVGNAASIADIDLYGIVNYAGDGGFALPDYPSIQAWMKRFEALPGFGKPEAILPKDNKTA